MSATGRMPTLAECRKGVEGGYWLGANSQQDNAYRQARSAIIKFDLDHIDNHSPMLLTVERTHQHSLHSRAMTRSPAHALRGRETYKPGMVVACIPYPNGPGVPRR